MGAQGTLGHFRKQGDFPRGREQRIRVVGDQHLAGLGRVDGVVVNQLGRVRAGPADAIHGVPAGGAAEAGLVEVLVGGKAKAAGIGEGFLEQQRNVQWDDLRIDLRQTLHQSLVEHAGQGADGPLERRAIDGRRQAQVRQHPHHDISGASLLQSLGAVGQATGCGRGLTGAEDQAVEEVIPAAGEKVQRVGVGSAARGCQVSGACTQHLPGVAIGDGGVAGDGIVDLLGGVAADGPVIAVCLALRGALRRGGCVQVASRHSQLAAQ